MTVKRIPQSIAQVRRKLTENLEESHRQHGEIGKEQKTGHHGAENWHDLAWDAFYILSWDGWGDEKIDAVGRRDEPAGEVHGDDEPEVYGVNANATHDKQENRQGLRGTETQWRQAFVWSEEV